MECADGVWGTGFILSLYNQSKNFVHIIGTKLNLQCVLDSARAAPCVIVECSASALGTSGLYLYFLRMMWFKPKP